MTWFDKDWNRRAPVTVDLHLGSGTVDLDIDLALAGPNFWDNVQVAAGNDIRMADGSGAPLTYKILNWNHATRTGNVIVNNWEAPNVSRNVQAWLYWDNSNASAGGSVFTPAGLAADGIIEIGSPGTGSESIVVGRREAPGADNSRTVISKHPDDITHIWWNVLPALMKRRVAEAESLLLEEVESATYAVLNTSDVAQGGMIETNTMRSLHPGWIRTTIKDGADDTNYVAKLTVGTTLGRKLTFHATVKVRKIHAPT
jgi:hypothetical protein